MKPDIKIVIVSAHLDHKNILEAKELGAYECTSKNSRMFRVLDQLIDTL
jgi:DNA-binding NarL/FixJ family response regulator